MGMEAYVHGAMDYAEKLKLRSQVGDLDLPESRRNIRSRVEEEIDEQDCPCGKAMESGTHIVGDCTVQKEGRDVLEEGMWELKEGSMKSLGARDSSEKTIAVLGGRWWPHTAKQEGDNTCVMVFV